MSDSSADRDAIRELIAKHAQMSDDAIVEERVALYAPDGVFTGPDGVANTGHDAIRAAFSKTAAGAKGGKHITSNTVVELEGDKATAFTDFAFFRMGTGGLSPFAAGRYRDTFVKTADGWRYASRLITFLAPPAPPTVEQ